MWKQKNSHNQTYPGGKMAYLECIKIGKMTYGCIDVAMSNKKNKLYIGNYCSIADQVKFILSSDHRLDTISTYPFKAKMLKSGEDGESKGDIVIKDDVWIGHGAIILSGVHIGQGAVIAAGAVVVKDVEPYSIVGGVPAKHIKFRFSKELREELIKIDFSKVDKKMVSNNIEEFYNSVETSEQLKWLPHK